MAYIGQVYCAPPDELLDKEFGAVSGSGMVGWVGSNVSFRDWSHVNVLLFISMEMCGLAAASCVARHIS